MTRTSIIVNPTAGHKAGLRTNTATLAALQAAVRTHDLPYDIVSTERGGHAAALARQAVQTGHDTVVAAGGDGTVREVIAALIGTPVRLGILPLGSAMNTARALGVPRQLDQALDLLRRAERVVAIDIGRVNNTIFVEAAGVGLTAGVLHLLGQLDAGRWHRWRSLLRYLRLARPRTLEIDLDGQRRRYRSLSLLVANAPTTGAGILVAPQARMDDGYLDLTIFLGETKRAFAAAWLSLLLGRPLQAHLDVVALQARRVTVMTRRPTLVHADDALAGRTPATFSLLERAVTVIVGAAAPGLAATAGRRPVVDGAGAGRHDPVSAVADDHAPGWPSSPLLRDETES